MEAQLAADQAQANALAAKRDATRDKRLGQMLDELAAGTAYTGMAWGGKH